MNRIIPRQPDDPGVAPANPYAPLVFGCSKCDMTPATFGVIRKNAGKMPALDLARAMGWTYRRLKRVADQKRIPLRYPPAETIHEPEPWGA